MLASARSAGTAATTAAPFLSTPFAGSEVIRTVASASPFGSL